LEPAISTDDSSTNPYAPTDVVNADLTRRPRLRGFARGARNGFLWSTPFMFMLGTTAYGYTESIVIATLTALQIPLIWCTVAGIVAMIQDRKKAEIDHE